MQETVLIAAVGFNPASVVVAARSLNPRPTRLVLLCTKQSAKVAEVVGEQLGLTCETWEFPANPAIDEARAQIVAKLELGSDEQAVLDITGATKPMCLSLWLALVERQVPFEAVYLEPDGRLRDARPGRELPGEARVTPREVAAWRGMEVTTARWEGRLDGLPLELQNRLEFFRSIFEHFDRFKMNAERLTTELRPPSAPPPGFEVTPGAIREPPGSGLFSRNVWLEELCLLEAAAAIGDGRSVEAALGCDLRPRGVAGNAKDEVDLVLVRGSRTLVVEAKARGAAGGGGAELQKRVAKTRTFFGDPAKVVFVHPAYNAQAQRDNQDMVDPGRVRVIGRDLATYRKAVRWALGG